MKPFGVYVDKHGNVTKVVTPAPGSIVRLKSGGPDMTVLDACDECGDVDVALAAGDGIDILTLPAAALVAA